MFAKGAVEMDLHEEEKQELAEPQIDLALSKFVYNFEQIFTEMHSVLEKEAAENPELVRDQVLEASNAMRDVLTQVDGLPEELGEFAIVIQLVWHLTEIFLLNSTPYTMLEMIDWLKSLVVLTSDVVPLDDTILRDMYQADAPENNDEYWEILHELVQVGELRSAWELLQAHSLVRDAARSNTGARQLQQAFQQLQQLFTTSPLYEFESKLEDIHEFRAGYARQWTDWSATVDRYLVEGVTFDPRVQGVVQLMAQDYKPHSKSEWHNALLRDLIYKYPKLTKRELSYVTQSCLEKFGGNGERFAAIRTYMDAVLDGDAGAVLGKLWQWDVSSHVSDESTGFFKEMCGVHLAELMDRLHLLNANQRDEFVIKYASDLWRLSFPMEVTLPYFVSSKAEGMKKWNDLLRTRVVTSDRDAERILAIRPKRGDIENLVCNNRAEHWCNRQRYGKAMQWLLRMGDYEAVLRLCDEVGVACMSAIASFHSLRYQFGAYKIGPPSRIPAAANIFTPHFQQDTKPILFDDQAVRPRTEAALFAVDAMLSAATHEHIEKYPIIAQLNNFRVSVGEALAGVPRNEDFEDDSLDAIPPIDAKCEQLRSAAEGILDLIEDQTYPVRFSLHLIDLACRISGWHELLRRQLARLDSNITFEPLLRHSEVQSLMISLQSVLSSHHRSDFVEGIPTKDLMELHHNLNQMLVASISYNSFDRGASVHDTELSFSTTQDAPVRRRVDLKMRPEHVQRSSVLEDLTVASRSISLLL